MEGIELIVLILQITTVLPKRHYSASDESIENLLYYKDCKHKKQIKTEKPELLRAESPLSRDPVCPCPRMCCSMCCDCNVSQNFLSRQMQPLQQGMQEMSPNMNLMQMEPIGRSPPSLGEPLRQPPVQLQIQPRIRKKRIKPNPQSVLQPPINGRRNFGSTRQNIKKLISEDDDIKKILRDLVRVTMQKVDLVEMVNSRIIEKQTTTEKAYVSDENDDVE